MKKLLLLLLVSNFAFSQASVQIRLVTQGVGSPAYDWSLGYPVVTSNSNDAGLNAIFSAYGVTAYQECHQHPYPPYQLKTAVVFGSYPPQFITDLLAYSTVVASAKVSTGFDFTDALRARLVNLAVGTPTGTNNNIIVTNDAGLNAIFVTYNVFYYTQSYPSISPGSALYRYFDVVCDCDKNLLQTALNNYTAVIENTDNVGGGAMLANPNFTTSAAVIYPNPFSNTFEIQTEEVISNYSLYDISGKQLINTNSKTTLDNAASQLNSGVYFLNLQLENGQKTNYKIVKK